MTDIASRDYLRKCTFRPYREGLGPVFTLITWDTGKCFGSLDKPRLGYELKQDGVILFEGEDFGCSSINAVDSDACVSALMSFLTLRPGDTDAEYFGTYTESQLAFTREHAEALACEVAGRFGVR